MQSYGSVQPGVSDCEAAKEAKVWEARGTITGLLIDMASLYGRPVALVIPLLIGTHVVGDTFTPCGKIDTNEFVCEYTRAYVISFPSIATVVLLLLVGRDLLQKRFYYGLLRVGGVLEFGNNLPWKDPLVILLCISFLHCLAFAFAVSPNLFHIVIDTASSATLSVSGAKEAAASLRFLLVVLGILVPITLSTISLYFAYDLTQSLVPISEFVMDADDKANSLAGLHVMNDASVSCLVNSMDFPARLLSPDEMASWYSTVIKTHKDEKMLERPAPASIAVLSSLWPTKMLLHDETFRKFWRGFVSIAIALLCYVCTFLLSFVHFYFGQLRAEGATTGHYKFVPLAIFIACFIPVLAALMAFSRTIS